MEDLGASIIAAPDANKIPNHDTRPKGEGKTSPKSSLAGKEAGKGQLNGNRGKEEKRGKFTTKTCMMIISRRKSGNVLCGDPLEDWEFGRFKRCGEHRAKGNASKQKSLANAKKRKERLDTQVRSFGARKSQKAI